MLAVVLLAGVFIADIGGLMGTLRKVKTAVKGVTRLFVKKEAVKIPVLEGNLLQGRRAMITGGTSGIGKAVAKAFISNGATVAVCGRSSERVTVTAKELGDKAFGVVLDVRNPETVAPAVEKACELLGGVPDVLVNSAGVNGGGKFGAIEANAFEEVVETNLLGTILVSQEVARLMVREGVEGNILNVSSSSGLRPANTPYTVSKWGIRGLTLGMAKSLVPHGIVVNAVAPGPTATPMLRKDGADISKPGSPIERYAMPEEIANMAAVLVSDLGRTVVGDTVYMTGGSGLITLDDIGGYDFKL